MQNYQKIQTPFDIWFNSLQLDIFSLSEWHTFSEKILSIISQSNNFSSYHSLSFIEKDFLIREALDHVSAFTISATRNKINLLISKSLDLSLHNHHLLGSQSFLYNACEHLLNRERNAMHLNCEFLQYFNTEFPSHLRIIIWISCLHIPRLDHLLNIIIQKTEENLNITENARNCFIKMLDPLFSDISSCVGFISDKLINLMKDILFYYFRLIQPNSIICIQHLKLLYPFVLVIFNSQQLISSYNSSYFGTGYKSTFPNFKCLSKTLYLYLSFLQKLPELSNKESFTDKIWQKEFSVKLITIIKSSDMIFYQFLCSLASNSEPRLVSSISQLFRPILNVLFVGYLDISVVLSIWDNCFLCIRSPVNFLPYAGACLLVVLKNDLMNLISFQQISTFFINKNFIVTTQKFRDVLTNITPELKCKLLEENGENPFSLSGMKSLQNPVTQQNMEILDDSVLAVNTCSHLIKQESDETIYSLEYSSDEKVKDENLTNNSVNFQKRDVSYFGNIRSNDILNNKSLEGSIMNSLLDDLERRNSSELKRETLEFWGNTMLGFQRGLFKVAHPDFN